MHQAGVLAVATDRSPDLRMSFSLTCSLWREEQQLPSCSPTLPHAPGGLQGCHLRRGREVGEARNHIGLEVARGSSADRPLARTRGTALPKPQGKPGIVGKCRNRWPVSISSAVRINTEVMNVKFLAKCSPLTYFT